MRKTFLILFAFVVLASATFTGHLTRAEAAAGSSAANAGDCDRPFTFLLFEVFKIQDGRIRQIEAVLDVVPYYMPSPWVKPAK